MCLNKRLILALIVLIVVVFKTNVSGQDYLDTVRIQMPNKVTVEYLLNYGEKNSFKEDIKTKKGKDKIRYVQRVQNLARSTGLKESLVKFLKHWKVLGIENLEDEEPLLITEKGQRITLEKRENPISVYFPKDKQLALTIEGKHQLSLQQKYFSVNIYFNSVEQLKDLEKYDFTMLSKNADKELEKNSVKLTARYAPMTAWFEYVNGDGVKLDDCNFSKSKAQQYLALSFGAGIENLKGEWNGSFNLDLSFVLVNNKRYTNRLGLAYDFMYNFSAGEKKVNHWLDIKYATNLSRNIAKTDWLGFSLGYLVKQNGDFFEKNMFRLGISKSIHRNMTITPHLYFKGFFKDVYPGFKISFHL